MAGHDLRRGAAERPPRPIRGITRGQHGRLRVDSLIEAVSRSFVEHGNELRSENPRRFVPDDLDFGQTGVSLQHAYRLRALPREDHGELHLHIVARLAPQVNPPPTPCISTRCPLRILPARMNSSSASGTDAAEVLP